MKVHRPDILVVGAGPAGSSAAAAAACGGARVLLVERRAAVGLPVRCAEYIPRQLVGELEIGRDFLVQPVRAMQTFLPDGDHKETRAPGFIIRRDLFDQALARAAEEAGARVLLATRVLSGPGGGVRLKEADGSLSEVEARVIVGADGPHSTVARWLGSRSRDLIPALQVRVPLRRPMDVTEVHFDRDFYAGYGWLFPKGREANVGLGMRPGPGTPGLREALRKLVSRLEEQGKILGQPTFLTAGWIPAEPGRETVRGNVLLVGDAAGQTHPITGAGVAQAVLCGRMAGRWAAEAVRAGDVGLLAEYDREWRDLFGETLQRAQARRQVLEREWARLDEVIRHCWVAFREYYAGTR